MLSFLGLCLAKTLNFLKCLNIFFVIVDLVMGLDDEVYHHHHPCEMLTFFVIVFCLRLFCRVDAFCRKFVIVRLDNITWKLRNGW